MGIIANSAIQVATWTVSVVLYLIGYCFSKLLFLAGLMLNWVLVLNSKIIDNPVVEIGWEITRDIANLGFVLLIIIIAFGTILRNESFQAKKTLPKLIIAALLINFSILIAGMALDIAGIFMNFFLHSAYTTTGSGGISQAIAGSLSPGSFLKPPVAEFSESLKTFGGGTVAFVNNLIFINIMTAVSAITMFTLAIMYLRRYITIGILLVLMPGAILMWTFGSGLWSKWVSAFLKQTFFGPAAAFFIYLALKSADLYEPLGLKSAAIDGGAGAMSNIASDAGSMIMMVALLLGGLMAAEFMSIAGAKGGLASARGAVNFLGKTLPLKLGSGALRTGKYVAGKAGEGITESKRPWLQKLNQKYQTYRKEAKVIGEGAKKVYETGGTSSIKSIVGAGMDEMLVGVKGYKARRVDIGIKKEEKKKKKEERTIKNIDLMTKGLGDLNKNLETINSAIFKEKTANNPDQNKIKSLETDAERTKGKIKGVSENIEKEKQGPNEEVEELKERLEKVEKKAEESKPEKSE
ncbi:hypothetical protein KJ671_01235 [Patescibacteria group bacterium]|nr:hypothetical protein [Patescibacteria group bacterium]